MRAGNGASSRTSAGTKSSSPPATTRGCAASTCSVNVEPERNIPQMKIGRHAGAASGNRRPRMRERLDQRIDEALLLPAVVEHGVGPALSRLLRLAAAYASNARS